jgi:hypothetical protein
MEISQEQNLTNELTAAFDFRGIGYKIMGWKRKSLVLVVKASPADVIGAVIACPHCFTHIGGITKFHVPRNGISARLLPGPRCRLHVNTVAALP